MEGFSNIVSKFPEKEELGKCFQHSMYLSMRRARKAMQFENYGEMLYEEGIDCLVRRIHREQLGREEAEDRELARCTGSPKIRYILFLFGSSVCAQLVLYLDPLNILAA